MSQVRERGSLNKCSKREGGVRNTRSCSQYHDYLPLKMYPGRPEPLGKGVALTNVQSVKGESEICGNLRNITIIYL